MRFIYSLYIDIPESDLDYQPPYPDDDIPKTQRTKLQFIENYDKLKEVQQQYAYDISTEYELFEYDDSYKEYHKNFKEKYPMVTEYCIVNFYKIHLLYELSKHYDEILYLDFDVVPHTELDFFDRWNLDKGVAILNNNDDASLKVRNNPIHNIMRTTNRSPVAKYWNCRAMLFEEGHQNENDVFNTGIIGINKEHIEKLDYFGNFDKTIELMTNVKNDSNLYPEPVRNIFGYDNETIWSYKTKVNKVKTQWLDTEWHYFYDPKNYFIPKSSKFIHVINKRFDKVWQFCERNEKSNF
jgi:hypothetical protein